jgi:major membrane immunogen (membrane-anchored lipoprotein)
MKKLFAMLMVAALLLAGCAPAATKLGYSSKTTIGFSSDLAEKDGKQIGLAQADTMMCAVVVDDSGRVVDIKIDTVQAKVNFDEEGKITTDKATQFKTKRELGDDYGMKRASPIGREWYEQADAIQKWMIGKTADQIQAMKVKNTEDHGNIPDEPDLVSSATIGVDDFIEVAVDAIKSAK